MLNFFETTIPSVALEQEVQYATQGVYGKAPIEQYPANRVIETVQIKTGRLSMIQQEEVVEPQRYELPAFTQGYLAYKQREQQAIMNSDLPQALKDRKLERSQVQVHPGSELELMERLERSRERRSTRLKFNPIYDL